MVTMAASLNRGIDFSFLLLRRMKTAPLTSVRKPNKTIQVCSSQTVLSAQDQADSQSTDLVCIDDKRVAATLWLNRHEASLFYVSSLICKQKDNASVFLNKALVLSIDRLSLAPSISLLPGEAPNSVRQHKSNTKEPKSDQTSTALSLMCINESPASSLTCLAKPKVYSLTCSRSSQQPGTSSLACTAHHQRPTTLPRVYRPGLASNSSCFSRSPAPSLLQVSPPPVNSSRSVVTSSSQVTEIKDFRDIPGPEGLSQWPLIGTVLNFKPFTHYTVWTLHEFLASLVDQYGPIVRFQFAGPTVLLSDPRDAEVLFQNEGRYPIRPPIDLGDLYCKRNNAVGGFNETQGEEWYALRSPANKRLLKPGSASHYLSQQNEVADDLVQILKSGRLNPEEFAETFFKYASESIGVVCFNARLGFLEPQSRRSLDTERFSQASLKHFQLLMHSVTGESVAHRFYRNKTYREFEDTCNVMNEITDKYLHKAISELQIKKQNPSFNHNEPNLLYSFLSDSSLDYPRIKVIMNNLYNGGTDSTAKNLMVLLFNLARNPSKQEKLYKEIYTVVGGDQPLTKDALADMHYLKACLKESFRIINPTALSALRVLHHDTIIRGYRVPAGTSVAYSTHKSSRENFVEPERFLPERWLRTQTPQGSLVGGFRQRREEESHLLANIPFGYGARGCLGRWFAEQEIYLATVKILQKLQIHIHPDSEKTKFGYAIFVEPDRPIRFIFTPREEN